MRKRILIFIVERKNIMTELEWMDIFSTNLQEMLEDARCSQEELAEDTGLTQATISRYINKKQLPGLKAIINISYALGCDLYDLIDFGDKID